ncbi:MAG: hypothetical protein HKN21_11385, partial [Candidatus Eisenbacteria bacterium]|nr:hypothetical protein [Candidatus Eisenbacteria bacterium]
MKIWSLALGLALLIPTSTLGATSLVVGIQDHRLNIDTGFLDDLDPVENNQKSLRATFTWDVNETFTVVAEGGGASSFLELTDETITGMTDLRLRGLYRVTDRWVLGAGTIIPFGLYELTSAEATTAQWTWNPRSGFPISSFGEGFGWEVTTAYGFPLGTDVTAGVA